MKIFRKILFIQSLLVSLVVVLFLSLSRYQEQDGFLSPFVSSGFNWRKEVKGEGVKPLDRYSFEKLKKRRFIGSKIKIGKEIEVEEEEKKYSAYYFYYTSDGKRVSGQLSVPGKGRNLPVVVMLRGYADKEIYFTGLGTRKASGFFAENGFVTLAPDFLGFGQSDEESADILLNRFRRPETVLSLLASLKNLNQALQEKGIGVTVDADDLFLWGHSNGGQIALSILEITGREIPTALWAPVTQGFPQSILQFASELDDHGKKVITAIDKFNKDYDGSKYSIASYFDWVKAPAQIHQGTGDEYIASKETKAFVESMKKIGKNITYYVYGDDDHNLKENWDLVVERDLRFFRGCL